MKYTIFSKPVPLTEDAIAYECKIYEDKEKYVNEKPYLIGNASVQINRNGDYDDSIFFKKQPIDVDAAKKELEEHCRRRASVVFPQKEK